MNRMRVDALWTWRGMDVVEKVITGWLAFAVVAMLTLFAMTQEWAYLTGTFHSLTVFILYVLCLYWHLTAESLRDPAAFGNRIICHAMDRGPVKVERSAADQITVTTYPEEGEQ